MLENPPRVAHAIPIPAQCRVWGKTVQLAMAETKKPGHQSVALDDCQTLGVATLEHPDHGAVDFPLFRWPDPETWPQGSILFLHPLDFEHIARMDAARERRRRELN